MPDGVGSGGEQGGCGVCGHLLHEGAGAAPTQGQYADKEAQEKVVRASELELVVVRPMLLTNGTWTNDYRARADLKPGRRPYISQADAADFLMRQLADDAFVRKTPAIGY